MLEIITEQLFFFLVLTGLFVLPGFWFVRFLGEERLSFLEEILLGLASGMTLSNFTLLILDALHLPLNAALVSFASLILLCLFYSLVKFSSTNRNACKPSFGKVSLPFVGATLLLVFLTVVVKTIYLQNTIFPTATDLGHHLFWVKKITQEEKLPVYEKQKLLIQDGQVILTEPKPVADFIIGEHTPFAAVNKLTGADLFGPEPVLFLFVLNVAGILALFVLARRLFDSFRVGHLAALAILFLAGPLWAISGAQAKFVSGGVVGNIMGNFFLPLIVLVLFLAVKNFSARLTALFFFLLAGLIYIHHLSTFVLLYVLVFVTIFLLFSERARLRTDFPKYLKMVFSPPVLAILTLMAALFLFVRLPQYLNPQDIAGATGTPQKETRTGLSWVQFMHVLGEPRFALSLVGLTLSLFFVFSARRVRRLGAVFVAAPFLATLLMTLYPQLLGVNIISSRIANYAVLFALPAAAAGLTFLLVGCKNLRFPLRKFLPLVLMFYIAVVGLYDNAQSLRQAPNVTKAQQTFAAGDYVRKFVTPGEWVLKDHNYLTADTWLKLSFLRDYSYPLSRSYFKRYEDKYKKRERCTLLMISEPFGELAQKCFAALNVRYLIVNPNYDGAQFRLKDNSDFARVYLSDDAAVYYRK